MQSVHYRILRSHKDTLHGPSGETRTPGILLPKQARYQLRYTRLWICFICGLSCGLGRFLTIGFAEMVPASGSVPAGCGVGLFPSWMGGICSQSRRATNCATPGYEVVGWPGRILPKITQGAHGENQLVSVRPFLFYPVFLVSQA